MNTTTASRDPLGHEYSLADGYAGTAGSTNSAVSWGAVLAGAAAAAALSLILLVLGLGLGLATVSPWSLEGISAESFGVSTIVWITVTQLLASAMGGYLAGRLRTKWIDTPADEIHFRDTAHGFLAWAVASLVTAVLITTVIGSVLNRAVQTGASVAGGVASAAAMVASSAAANQAASGEQGPWPYFVDSLFRRDGSAAATSSMGAAAPVEMSAQSTSQETEEVGRIFTEVNRSGPLPAEDMRHIAQLVAQRTGLSQQEAEKRVMDTYVRAQAQLRDAQVAAREAADQARKASAYAALWFFVALLSGAFIASLAAIWGGRQRDF